MWHITFALRIAFAFLCVSTILSAILWSKNSVITSIPFFLETSATFLDGSTPRHGMPSVTKFYSIMPSLLPTSTTNEFSSKSCKSETDLAKFLKCSFI